MILEKYDHRLLFHVKKSGQRHPFQMNKSDQRLPILVRIKYLIQEAQIYALHFMKYICRITFTTYFQCLWLHNIIITPNVTPVRWSADRYYATYNLEKTYNLESKFHVMTSWCVVVMFILYPFRRSDHTTATLSLSKIDTSRYSHLVASCQLIYCDIKSSFSLFWVMLVLIKEGSSGGSCFENICQAYLFKECVVIVSGDMCSLYWRLSARLQVVCHHWKSLLFLYDVNSLRPRDAYMRQ